MKAFIIFMSMVMGYATINLVHLKVDASTYRHGIEAYLNRNGKIRAIIIHDGASPKRGPAIELTK